MTKEIKKIGIVAYYWPPAGGPGVQRWLYFCKYLTKLGFEVHVFLPKTPHYPMQDRSLLNEVDADIKIHKTAFFEPYGFARLFGKKRVKSISSGIIPEKKPSAIAKLLLTIRGNFFIPDARKYWRKPGGRQIAAVHKEEKLDLIITTGPPHSVHLLGKDIQDQLGIPWIADFRDPWTSIGYHQKLGLCSWAAKKHKQLEKEILDAASALVVTSFATAKEFQRITQTPIQLITNGFEPKPIPEQSIDDKFSLVHIGSLLSARNPKILWEVLVELLEEVNGFIEDLQLEFVGIIGEEIQEDIARFGLESYTRYTGYLSHEEVLRKQRQSRLLLLLEIDAEITRGIIPGKLFEYMDSGRPILALGPQKWDVAKILNNKEATYCLWQKDKQGIKAQLLHWYKCYKQNINTKQQYAVETYTRNAISKQLVQFITSKPWE
ncbi:MAG: glycosyltransferase [Flavobacteriaceae bacterium]|nr:glycosyltransferase [Flavobacteriaceae bacterium]